LINEISSATKEQTEGVGQINNALQEMDTVVQSNAATAEESASASEELFAESNTLLGHVRELQTLITGEGGPGSGAMVSQTPSNPARGKNTGLRPAMQQKQSQPRAISHSAKKTAKEVIPFDEEEFEDF